MRELEFQNCLKLDEESRRVIIQRRVYDNVCLPGEEVHVEFTHKALGNSLIFPMVVDGNGNFLVSSRLRFKACLLLSPVKDSHLDIACLITKGGVTITKLKWDQMNVSHFMTEHLFICGGSWVQEAPNATANEIQFEFSCRDGLEIIECGVEILSDEAESSSRSSYHHTYGDKNFEPQAVQVYHHENVQSRKYKFRWKWSWLKKLFSGKEDDNVEFNIGAQPPFETQPVSLQPMSPIMI